MWPSRPPSSVIPIVVGAAVLGLTLIHTDISIGGPDTVTPTSDDIVSTYIKIAFGRDPKRDSPERNQALLSKRDTNIPANFLLFFGDSFLSDESRVSAINATLAGILVDLAQHSEGFRYKLYSPAELKFAAWHDAAARREILSNSIEVFVGTAHDIDLFTMAQQKTGVPIRKTFDEAATLASTHGSRLCFGGSTLRTGGRNQIGESLIYIEDGDDLVYCMYRTIMQSSGLNHILPNTYYSIFTGGKTASSPTNLDWSLWALHMNPIVSYGMTEQQVRLAASQIPATPN